MIGLGFGFGLGLGLESEGTARRGAAMPVTRKQGDAFVWWIVSGILGVLAQDAFWLALRLAGLADTHVWDVAASLAVSSAEACCVAAMIVGGLLDLVIGGLFAILIGVLLEWRGSSAYLVKGLTVGLGAWVFCYGILIHNLPFFVERDLVHLSEMIGSFFGHAIYGAVTVTVYVKWLSRYVEGPQDQ